MLRVAIIIGSTRPGRKAEAVTRWVYDIASKRSDAAGKGIALRHAGRTDSRLVGRPTWDRWSAGGVPAADTVMLDVSMDLFNTEDVTRGFLNTAEAFDRDVEPPDMVFDNR